MAASGSDEHVRPGGLSISSLLVFVLIISDMSHSQEIKPIQLVEMRTTHGLADTDNLTEVLQIQFEIQRQGGRQQSLAETLSGGSLTSSGSSGNVANYMGQMAMAMGKLGTHQVFIRQADNLLQQMHRILTARQSARALLAIHDYFSRPRALSSLWHARPHE